LLVALVARLLLGVVLVVVQLSGSGIRLRDLTWIATGITPSNGNTRG
jgi:hypothetical protein